ncbi:MAG: PQQ-dependent sugar dehydrogenase [Fibrobacteria bacterium]
MRSSMFGSLAAVLVGCAVNLAFPQGWTTAYTSPTATGECGGLPAGLNTGFAVTPIVSRALFTTVAPARVIKMAFFKQAGVKNTDIYIAEKGATGTMARVLRYNGSDATLTAIGTLPSANYGGGGVEEQGLVGIALNPKTFATDNFLYLFYTAGSANIGSASVGFKLSRFTLNATTKMIDFASEKVLLQIPAGTTGRWHTGGAMQFDNAGNLYISVGDNESLATGPANTADLRGGILRIKPDAADPKGYTIPAGNFGEYWAGEFQTQGLTGLATQYRDPAKVRPEIYIKGTRNVYSFSVDKTRSGMVEYSQCGPDAQRGETHSLTTKPAFGGWPFWVFNNGSFVRQTAKAAAYDEAGEPSATDWAAFNPASMSTDRPVNNWSGNTGVDTLPPYNKPFYGVSNSCAAGGPIIHYDGSLDNPGQMPPQLDNTVMVTDAQDGTGTNNISAAKVNPTTGAIIGSPTPVFTMARSGRPSLYNSLDFQQGADGALYMVDWGAGCCSATPPAASNGIVRITYTGTCKDPALTSRATPHVFHNSRVDWLLVQAGRITLKDDATGLIGTGSHTIRVMDVQGKVLYKFEGVGAKSYDLPRMPAGQLYILRAETPIGYVQRTFSQL